MSFHYGADHYGACQYDDSTMAQVQLGASRCHGLRVYPVCVCNTVRLGQVRSRHNLKPSGTRFEYVSGLSV